MALTSGTRIGPYEVTAQIGRGGMGEVYRALDTNLKRPVAIKVLPASLAGDPERLARFQREAEVLAQLNHPNIAAIHGLEKADGYTALVMELVEGPTLADRIAQGAIPLDEALPIAKQVAEALEAAHERGIVHRDLKPANIKVRADGMVKVLDFGLAKAMEPAGTAPPSNVSQLPTITTPAMTQVGVILGTAAYMAPEQARGRKTDQRADIWAFGVVLYEMVTGKRLFDGEDLTDTIASVVKQEPDLRTVPREVRKVVAACLKKDPRQRLQAIGDWKLLLAEGEPDTPFPVDSGSTWAPWLAAGAAALTLAVLAFVHFREVPPDARVMRLSVPVPDNSQVAYLELSPDGQRLLAAIVEGAVLRIVLRSLDAPESTPLAGTNGARTPFWSPDSRSRGFFADASLKVVPAAGGPAQVLCRETGLGGGGTWNREGVILFASENGRLRRVDARGGECRPVGKDDASYRAGFPVFLPDGRHFLYVGRTVGDEPLAGVHLATLDDFPGRRVLADDSSVVYTPAARGGRAHLLFLRESTLMAQPFDEARLEAVGNPFVVAEQGSRTFTGRQVAASAAADGTLVYLAGRSRESQLTWMDRTGKELGTVGPRADQRGVALSPDGHAVAIGRLDPNGQPALWLHDLVRGSESRLTPPGSRGPVVPAVWSHDASRIWFNLSGSEGSGLYQKDLRSGALDLVEKRDPAAPARTGADWSRDGRSFIYTENDPKTRADIWYVPLENGKPGSKPVRLLGTEASESQGQASSDGKWLAYTSTESGTGTSEVYIRQFPTGEGVWRISVDGGREPRWRTDGRELFFQTSVGADRIALFAVAVAPDGRGGLRISTPQRLFDVAAQTIVPQSNVFAYSPHPDGQRFLVNALAGPGEETVNVITNWRKAAAVR